LVPLLLEEFLLSLIAFLLPRFPLGHPQEESLAPLSYFRNDRSPLFSGSLSPCLSSLIFPRWVVPSNTRKAVPGRTFLFFSDFTFLLSFRPFRAFFQAFQHYSPFPPFSHVDRTFYPYTILSVCSSSDPSKKKGFPLWIIPPLFSFWTPPTFPTRF